MESPRSARERAEEAFHRWLASTRDDESGFLAEHPDDVRAELERILADYHLLRRGMGSPDDEEPERILGDFRLIEQIGRGGMGVIWEAEQVSLGRRVALKLLHPHFGLSDETLTRFQREARAGGRLRHPGIVAVHGAGVADGYHWIAQELVPGGRTLADELADLRALPELPKDHYRSLAARIAKVADALQAAHDEGVVHRDVKPSNLLIGADGEPKIADFGLALVQEELAQSRTGELLGTPFYMSPEQAASRRIGIDHRTDVFSLGATLYEGLALVRPFEGDTSQQVLHKILLEDPPDPRKLRSRVPRDLAVICRKAMEKRPQHRYPSARAMQADLERWLTDRPIHAHPPGPTRRAAQWCRRHPVLSVASALTTVGLVSVLGLSYEVQAQRGDAALANAEARALRADLRESLEEAERERVRARGLRLFSQAEVLRSTRPDLSLLLTTEAAELTPGRRARNTLLDALDRCDELRTLVGHEGEVFLAELSVDGSRILTLATDRTARVWDTATGEERARISHGGDALDGRAPALGARRLSRRHRVFLSRGGDRELHEGDLTHASFDPEGTRVLVVGRSGATVHRASDGELRVRLEGHTAAVVDGRFDPSGTRAVTVARDDTARIWNVSDGSCVAVLTPRVEVHGTPPSTQLVASFDASGERVITSGFAATTVWDAEDGSVIVELEGAGTRASFLGPGERVLTFDVGVARVFDAWTGAPVASMNTGLSCAVGSAGRWIVSTSGWHVGPDCWSSNEPAGVWDATSATRRFELPSTACFGVPDHAGERVALGVRPNVVELIDLETGDSLGRLRGHLDEVLDVAFSRSGRELVTASRDGTARVWDVARRPEVSVPLREFADVLASPSTLVVQSRDLDPDRARTAGGGIRGPTEAIETTTGASSRIPWVETRLAHAFALGNTTFVLGVEADRVRCWSTAEGGEVWTRELAGAHQFYRGGPSTVSPDGRILLCAPSAVVVADLHSGRAIDALELDDRWLCAALYPDGASFLVTRLHACERYRVGEPGPTSFADVPFGVTDLRIVAGGERVFGLTSRAEVAVWDGATGARLALYAARADRTPGPFEAEMIIDQRFGANSRPAVAYAMSVGRELAAFAGAAQSPWEVAADGSVAAVLRREELWWVDLRPGRAGRERSVSDPRTRDLTCIAVDAVGARLITGASDGAVRVWETASGAEHMRVQLTRPVRRVWLEPVSDRFFALTANGAVRSWPMDPVAVARARRPRELTPAERAQFGLSERDGPGAASPD